ncbi:hypothetical protein [Litchfieldella rifensis]|uniref:VanZ-like domain-containing protein n=1 Tax=Litchfieldella rifensis TaxID=762643 RepID=A0ABV7LVS5_9GAMM
MRIDPSLARWPLVILSIALLAFLIGGLMPSPVRAAIEQRMNLPFSVPPVAHVALCAVMTASLRWWRPAWHAGAVLAVVLLIGGVAEIGQHWIPHRTPNWGDMGLNLAGGLLGLLVMSSGRRYSER